MVGVHKNFRRKGIAKKMMEKCIEFISRQRYPIIGIHSNNPTAIRMYTQLDFKIVEGGSRVYMELTLPENELPSSVGSGEELSALTDAHGGITGCQVIL